MKDFVFVKNAHEIPLPDDISVCDADEIFGAGGAGGANPATNGAHSNSPAHKLALIGNVPSEKFEIYAPEINFYLKNSQDDYLARAQNTLRLYEARASAFDYGADADYEKPVGARVIVASRADKSRLCAALREAGFKAVQLGAAAGVYGSVGELVVIARLGGADGDGADGANSNLGANQTATANGANSNLNANSNLTNSAQNFANSNLTANQNATASGANSNLTNAASKNANTLGQGADGKDENADEVEIECDFFLYDEPQPSFARQSGCYDLRKFEFDADVAAFLRGKSPTYRYKQQITYDSTICQHHHRRTDCCGLCADACPTAAILKDAAKRELVFSHIDCTGCGACVSVCPSGALDFAPLPRAGWQALLDFYRGKKIVIFDEDFALESLEITLPAGFLPLVLRAGQLSETTLLALLQTSGASVVLCAAGLPAACAEAVGLINEIFARRFGAFGVIMAHDEASLREGLAKCDFIENLAYEIPQAPMLKREHFAKRLAHIVGAGDLGVVKSGEWVRYGRVSVSEAHCTLCLACVGACNAGALVADSGANALTFNASLCTTCGYCVDSCAEPGAIALERGGLGLSAGFLAFGTLARDELFKCVQCGKEFATAKAVERVASLMREKFAHNEKKLKTLYCCAECKAKTMIFG